ncbi:unnamed protein product, partial [Dicrocoelium dendriticum]
MSADLRGQVSQPYSKVECTAALYILRFRVRVMSRRRHRWQRLAKALPAFAIRFVISSSIPRALIQLPRLDIRAAFDPVDRTVLWHCLLRNGVPEKFVSILRSLHSLTSGRVRAYGKLSPTFVVSSGVRQGCPISPFLFNFAIEDVLKNALGNSLNAGVELLPGNRVVDLDYADDIVLLGDDPHV